MKSKNDLMGRLRSLRRLRKVRFESLETRRLMATNIADDVVFSEPTADAEMVSAVICTLLPATSTDESQPVNGTFVDNAENLVSDITTEDGEIVQSDETPSDVPVPRIYNTDSNSKADDDGPIVAKPNIYHLLNGSSDSVTGSPEDFETEEIEPSTKSDDDLPLVIQMIDEGGLSSENTSDSDANDVEAYPEIIYRALDDSDLWQTVAFTGSVEDTNESDPTGQVDESPIDVPMVIAYSGAASGSVESWWNAALPTDADSDGAVTVLDALQVINALNSAGMVNVSALSQQLSAARGATATQLFGKVDINHDSFLTPLDALIVVNQLNLQFQNSMLQSGQDWNTNSRFRAFVCDASTDTQAMTSGSIDVSLADMPIDSDDVAIADPASLDVYWVMFGAGGEIKRKS